MSGRSASRRASAASSVLACAAGALLLLASLARGQTSTPAVVAPAGAGDTVPAFARRNGTLLRPGSFVYRLSLKRDTLRRDLGTRAVDVTETNAGGVAGWLVAESRLGTAVRTTDSLYLARADLSPTRWVAASGAARLAASFTRDSMYGAMQSYQGRASFVTELPAGALLTPGMVERIVELLPLQAGYRASASWVLVELGTPRAVPAEIVVEREEPVTLPDNKSVDSWVVRLAARSGGGAAGATGDGALQERLWVTKGAPRVVKTEQVTAAGVVTAVLQPAPVIESVPSLADLFPGGGPIIVPGSRPVYLSLDRPSPPVRPAVRATPASSPPRPR